VDRRRHDRTVDAQLAATRHLEAARQVGHPIQQPMHRRRLQQIGPAHQCRVVRHRLEAKTTELAQHQAVANEVLGLRVAPVVQVLHDQQPQDHFNGCGWPPGSQRVWPTSAQIGFDLVEDVVVFEQPIQLCQLGFEPQLECGYQGEQVDWRGAIS
jgi:hypothetical protein